MCLDRQWHTDEISGVVVLVVKALQYDHNCSRGATGFKVPIAVRECSKVTRV